MPETPDERNERVDDELQRLDAKGELSSHVDVEVMHRKEHNRYLPTLLMVTLAALALVLVASIIVVARQETTNNKLDAAQDRDLTQQHDACLRSNDARQVQVQLYEGLIAGNKARRSAWEFYLANVAQPGQQVTGAPVVQFAHMQIAANELEISNLTKLEESFIAANIKVAQFPDASDPARRVIVDCDKLFPTN